MLSVGTHNISFTATDDAGNSVSCSFELIVDELLGIGDNTIDVATIVLFPNPVKEYISISNPQQIVLNQAVIYDITGRKVTSFNLQQITSEGQMNISALASGSYVVVIGTDYGNVIKHLVKE